MAESISQLKLEAVANTKQAQKDVKDLNKALQDLSAVAASVGKGNNIANYGKQIKEAANTISHINGRMNIRKAIDAFNETPNMGTLTKFANAVESEYDRTAKGIASSASKSKSALSSFKGALRDMDFPLKNFAKSLTRIAKLRLLRGIIRSITGAFKEGTSNLYQYSAALNSADGARFANSMNAISTSLLYMKNSIGAAVAPLITSLVPAIQTVVSWFVTATQAVAQFFAALGGQVMYSRAKEYETAWKDVGAATGGAAAAAKEYENTILGFDELNVLNDPSQGGGGGGGGGASAPDYSSMFEEAEISQKIRDLTQWIKDNFEDIKDLALAIGGILLGWKIAQGVANFFESLGFTNAAGIRQLGLGLVLTITGVTLATKGGFDIGYEGVDLMNVIKTALGVGLAGVGGALTANAITSLGWASIGTGVGAVFGIGIALVGTIVGFTIGKGKQQREAIISNLESYDGEFAMIMERQNGYAEEAELAWSTYFATLGKTETAKNLTDQLDAMASKANLSSAEVEHAKALIKQLNDLGLDGIRAEWNETTGRIEINTQEIYNNIEAIRENAKTVANQRILTKAYEDQGNALVEVATAQGMVDKAQSAYNAKLSQYQDVADALGISLEELGQQHEFQSIYLADEVYALGQANMALETAQGKYDDATRAIKDTEKALGYVTDEFEDASGAVVDFSAKVSALGNLRINDWVAQGLDRITHSAYWARAELQNVKDLILGIQTASLSGIGIAVAINGATPKAEGGYVGGYANGGYIPSYASGGINSADLFLANENANPELVGRIGSRTAVANQGQMVDALASGVYRAMAEAQNGGSSNIEVVVNMDGVAVARANDRGQKALNRRFNVQLA